MWMSSVLGDFQLIFICRSISEVIHGGSDICWSAAFHLTEMTCESVNAILHVKLYMHREILTFTYILGGFFLRQLNVILKCYMSDYVKSQWRGVKMCLFWHSKIACISHSISDHLLHHNLAFPNSNKHSSNDLSHPSLKNDKMITVSGAICILLSTSKILCCADCRSGIKF